MSFYNRQAQRFVDMIILQDMLANEHRKFKYGWRVKYYKL